MGKGARVIGSTAETARKRPERPWTAARTMEVLRRCPLAIAQRLVHCAIALSTAVLDRVTKTMSVAPLLTNNLDNSKQKMSNLLSPAPPPYSWSLLGKSEGPAPPPSSKISWSFDLAWNPGHRGSEVLFNTVDYFVCSSGAGIAQWLEHRTRDWKVAGSNPCWNGGRIFFSRVDFLCWLLFRYPFHPRVTAVARKKSRSFCQKVQVAGYS